MSDEPSQAAHEQAAARQAIHEQGVAAQRAREYPNPYAERPARLERETGSGGPPGGAPDAKALADAEARERKEVGRDRSGPPIAPQPHPHNAYAEYERQWGHELDRERER